MRMIGLIGGMSWESTAVYYRLINTLVRERLGGLRSAEVVVRSVDFQRIVTLQKAGDWAGASQILGDIAEDLARIGAESVLICTNTMHLIADEVAARPGVRLLNIIDETATAIKTAGLQRPLLLATAYTMEHGFYTERMAKHGVEIMVPDAPGRAFVHQVIFDELCQGVVSSDSRIGLMKIIARAKAMGADSVILGCTEICLILDPTTLGLPGFDSTTIHAQAAVELSLRDEIAPVLASNAA